MVGPVLSHLFAQAIHTGKRARAETAISRHTTSVSHAGVLLLRETLGPSCAAARVLLVGAGEMVVTAAQALSKGGVIDLAFINRTFQRAEALALEFNGRALTWYQLEEALAWADAVICATGAPHIVIYRHDVEPVLPLRDGRPLVFIDIAVPRDVEDAVRALPGVEYHDIDDLQSVVDAHKELRKAAVPQVEAIIAQETARFDEWHSSREITPVIKTLRDWGQSVADEEVLRTLNRLADADERTRELVTQLAHRLVNRLLHPPTARLRVQAVEGNGSGYAHAVRELFALQSQFAHGSHKNGGCCGAARQGELDAEQCSLQCLLPDSTQASPVEPPS